jgi:hypothetical protein
MQLKFIRWIGVERIQLAPRRVKYLVSVSMITNMKLSRRYQDDCLLRHDAVYLGKYLGKFQRNQHRQSSK